MVETPVAPNTPDSSNTAESTNTAAYSNTAGRPHVVVGVDSSDDAARAAVWAAGEAAERGLGLVLVHAVDLPRAAGADFGFPEWAESGRADGLRLLDRIRCALQHRYPDLPVSAEVSDFGAAKTLVVMSGAARFVVTGARGHGGFAGLLLGSVSLKLAAHAQCPAVVVRGEASQDPCGEIVLGVEPGQPEAPVRFAFAAAAQLGARVRVVRAWTPDPMYGGYYCASGTQATERELIEDFDGRLRPLRDLFPGVEVSLQIARGNPVPTLIDAARGARLLIVGARRRRTPLSVGAGHVVHGLLSHCPTPVAVVPIV